MPGHLVHLVSGATGAGKTTYAIALAGKLNAVRFSIDEWMTTLFWYDSPQPIQYDWTIARIDRCETQIASLVVQLASRGVPSVLDLGFTRSDHRARFASLAREAGHAARLHFIDVPAEERWRRVSLRNREKGETWRLEVTRDMFAFMDSIWEPPGAEEMAAMDGILTKRPRRI